MHLVRAQLFAAQLCRRAQHGLHRLDITGAPAEHTRQRLAHLRFARRRILVQQLLGGQQLGRGAVAALDRAAGDELLLQRMEVVVARARKALDGDDGGAVGLHGQDAAAVDQAIGTRLVRRHRQQDGVGAGERVLVAKLDAVVAQAAQGRAQQLAGMHVEAVIGAVDGEMN